MKCPVRPEVLRLWFPDVWLSSPLGAGGTRKQLWAAGPGRLHLPGCSQLCGSAGNPRASFPQLLTKAPSHAHESVGPQEFPQRSPSFVRYREHEEVDSKSFASYRPQPITGQTALTEPRMCSRVFSRLSSEDQHG